MATCAAEREHRALPAFVLSTLVVLMPALIAFCGQHLVRHKVPRSIDFEPELPRLPTGKLYKRLLRDRYWGNKPSRIV